MKMSLILVPSSVFPHPHHVAETTSKHAPRTPPQSFQGPPGNLEIDQLFASGTSSLALLGVSWCAFGGLWVSFWNVLWLLGRAGGVQWAKQGLQEGF